MLKLSCHLSLVKLGFMFVLPKTKRTKREEHEVKTTNNNKTQTNCRKIKMSF